LKTELQNLRVQKWVAAVSVILLAVKIIAYYYTYSVSILTDALESIVNVIAGLIGLYSLNVAARPRDTDHPYGHGKAEFISAAIEGTMITIAGALILYKAVMNLINPPVLRVLDLGMMLIGVTAVINFILGYYCLRTGRRNNSLALVASGKHLQTDSWSTIGIIGGLFLLLVSGYIWIDSAVALGFGLFIMYTGYRIIRSSVAGIMDEADIKLLTGMVEVLNASKRENWVDLHNLRVIKYGSVLHLDCHLTVPWYLNVNEAHREVDSLAALVRARFGETLELFVHVDGCLPFQCHICNKENCRVRQQVFGNRVDWTLENVLKNKKHGQEQ
jgi:cation diffusion facilitator family transporter